MLPFPIMLRTDFLRVLFFRIVVVWGRWRVERRDEGGDQDGCKGGSNGGLTQFRGAVGGSGCIGVVKPMA